MPRKPREPKEQPIESIKLQGNATLELFIDQLPRKKINELRDLVKDKEFILKLTATQKRFAEEYTLGKNAGNALMSLAGAKNVGIKKPSGVHVAPPYPDKLPQNKPPRYVNASTLHTEAARLLNDVGVMLLIAQLHNTDGISAAFKDSVLLDIMKTKSDKMAGHRINAVKLHDEITGRIKSSVNVLNLGNEAISSFVQGHKNKPLKQIDKEIEELESQLIREDKPVKMDYKDVTPVEETD